MDSELKILIDKKIEESVLQHQTKVLLVLQELDKMHAGIACEMMRLRTSENMIEQFNDAWDTLKRLIYEIETKGDSRNGKETNQLEA